MLRLALASAPDAVLVTDAVATVAPVEERDGAAYLPDGTLAGSTLTMADAVQRVAALGSSRRGRGSVRDRQCRGARSAQPSTGGSRPARAPTCSRSIPTLAARVRGGAGSAERPVVRTAE